MFPFRRELVPARKMVPVEAEPLAAVILPVTVSVLASCTTPPLKIFAAMLALLFARTVENDPTDPPRISQFNPIYTPQPGLLGMISPGPVGHGPTPPNKAKSVIFNCCASETRGSRTVNSRKTAKLLT